MAVRSWIRRLFVPPFRSGRRRPLKAATRSQAPRLEALEERVVPAGPPNEFAQFLYNTPATTIISGIDAALDNVQADLNSVLATANVPVIGAQLKQAIQPLTDSIAQTRSQVQDQISSLYANKLNLPANANFIDLFQNTLFTIFGPSGLNVLLKGQESLPYTVTSTSPSDVAITYGSELESDNVTPVPNTDWLEFDVHLGGLYRIDLPFQVGEELNSIPGLNLGLQLDGTNGVRLQFTWDLRLGMGIDQRFPNTNGGGVGFYLNAGTKDGFGNSVPAFQATADVYSAPPKDAFGNDLYSDATQGLSGTISLGPLQATVSDGTPWVPTVTAPIGLPLSGDYSGKFTLTLSNADGSSTKSYPIVYNSPNGNETLANFVLNLQNLLNTTLNADYPGDTDPVFVSTTSSRINGILYPGLPQQPSLVLTANVTPGIGGITVTGGGQYGFVDNANNTGSQVDENNMSDLDFSSGVSTAEPDGTQVLTSGPVTDKGQNSPVQPYESAAPFLLTDAQMFIDLGTMTGPGGATIAGKRLQVLLREQPNRNLAGLSETELGTDGNPIGNNSLQYVLQQLVSTQLTNNGYDPNLITVSIDGTNDVILTAHPLNGYTAPVMNFDFTPNDRTKLSLTFGVTFVAPGYNSTTGAKPNDESTYNWLRFDQIEKAASLTDVFKPELNASAALRLHVTTDFGTVPIAGQTFNLPKISFDLMADASLTLDSSLKVEPSLDDLEFNNVTLDPGSLLNEVAVPVANVFGDVLGPITSVLGTGLNDATAFLNQPVAGLSNLMSDPPTYFDLLTAGNSANEQALDDFLNAVSGVLTFAGDAATFLQTYDGRAINFGSFTYSSTTGTIVPTQIQNIIDTVTDISLDKFVNKYSNFFERPGGFTFNLLDPTQIVNMLTGNTFNIVSLNLPQLDLSLGLDTNFNVLGQKVALDLGGTLKVDLGVVYDSTGIQEVTDAVRSGGTPDYANLLDGLYIPAGPTPQLSITVTASTNDSFNIPSLGTLNLNLGLNANAALQVIDPAGTGKLRLREILNVTNNFTEPQELFCLFDASGSASGTFDASGTGTHPITGQTYSFDSADLGIPTSFNFSFDLQQLLGSDFDNCAAGSEILATPTTGSDGASVLLINTGPNAFRRLYGSTDDSNGPVHIVARTDPATGDILVSDPDFNIVDQRYSGHFDRIEAIGTAFADGFDFSGVTNTPVSVQGAGGDDTLVGGSGNDTIVAGAGNSHVTDGGGDDLIDLSQNTAGAVIRTGGGSDTIYGSAFADNVTATGGGNVLFVAGSGDATFDARGNSGNDTAVSGGGNDTFYAGSGADSLVGGTGNDCLVGGAGADTLTGGEGNDTLIAGSGNNYLADGGGNDSLVGGTGNDTLVGGDGNDTLVSGAGPNQLYAGAGDNLLIATYGTSYVQGGTGTDALVFDGTSAGPLSTTSGSLNAGAVSMTFNGTTTLLPLIGIASLQVKLGDGTNTFAVSGTTVPVTVNAGAGSDTISLAGSQAAVDLEGGSSSTSSDTFMITLPAVQAPATVNGGSGHSVLTVDDSADFVPRLGSLSPTTLSGLGMADITYAASEVDVKLGTGIDQYTISGTNAGTLVDLDTNSAADSVSVESIGDVTRVHGTGNNVLTLVFPSTPVAGEFANLEATVNTLRVDNSANTAAVGWSLKDRQLYAGSVFVTDASAVGTVTLIGGSGGSSTLAVTDDVNTFKTIDVNHSSVQITDGENVLTPSSFQTPTSYTYQNGMGIDNVSVALVTSPDGNFVYAGSLQGVAIFRKNGAGRLEEIGVFTLPLPAGDSFSDMSFFTPVMSPDGKFVYFGRRLVPTDPSGSERDDLLVLQRDTTTGLLTLASTIQGGLTLASDMVGSPDGKFLYVNGDPNVSVYGRNATTGALTLASTFSTGSESVGGNTYNFGSGRGFDSLVISPDGKQVYAVAATAYLNGDTTFTDQVLDLITVLNRDPTTGTLTLAQVLTGQGHSFYENPNAIVIAAPSFTLLSPDGQNFYGFVPFTSSSGGEVWGYTRHADGTLSSTHTATTVFQPGASTTFDPRGMAISPDGDVLVLTGTRSDYKTDNHPIQAYARAADGSLSFYDSVLYQNGEEFFDNGIAFSPDSSELYVTNPQQVPGQGGPGTLSVFTIQPTTPRIINVPAQQTFDASFQTKQATHLQSVKVVGSDVYAVDPTAGALVHYTLNSQTGALTLADQFFEGVNGLFGLAGASDVLATPDGEYVYVASPTDGGIAVFSRDSTTGLLTYQTFFGGLSGASSLAMSGNVVAVATGSNVVFFNYSSADGSLTETAGGPTAAGVGTIAAITPFPSGSTGFYVSGTSGLAVFRSDLASHQTISGNFAAAAISPDGTNLDVVTGSSAITVFSRGANGTLTELSVLRDREDAAVGLAGLGALAFQSNTLLYAAGATDNSLVVFTRDPSTGRLDEVQRLTDGLGGAHGLSGANSLAVVGNVVVVGSAGAGVVLGGVASYLATTSPPAPIHYEVDYQTMNSLTVSSPDSGTTRASVVDVTSPAGLALQTGDGADVLSVSNGTSPTAVTLGNGDNTIDIYASDNVTVTGGNGGDTMRLWGANPSTTVSLVGGSGGDIFRVAGAHLPSNSKVVIDGGAPSVLPGDLLQFDGGGTTVSYFDATGASVTSPTLPAGSVNAAGSGTVKYGAIERFVTLNATQANAGGPYTTTEGDSVTFDATKTVVPAGQTATYEWDLNSDGTFTDAFGSKPTLTWQQLAALGVNDDGTYRVAVRVVTSAGSVDVATATLTVNAATPQLTLSGPATATQGQTYTLTLSATDPGHDTVDRWDVNWGDGSPVETYYAPVATVTHVYGAAPVGPETISVSAYDPDGGPYTATKAITVNAVAATVRSIGTADSPVEGTPFTLGLTASGPGAGSVQQWTIFWGDGTNTTVAGTTTSVQHTYANDGTYTVEALVTEGNGTVHPADNTLKLTATAVAPVLSVADSFSPSSGYSFGGSYTEGAANTFTLSAQEPGTDAVSEWIIDWGDGTSSRVFGPDSLVTQHTYYADGQFTLRVGAVDEDGLHVSPTTYAVSVAEVPPTLAIAGPGTSTEGALYTLGLSASDPGRGTIASWTVNWGDGTVQTVPGNPSALIHTYQKPGTWIISATATDQTATYAAGNTVAVVVTAPALAPTIGGLPFAFEGSTYTLNLADNNPTQYPVNGWAINWGDGSPVQMIVGPATSVTHVYKDGGPVTLDPTTGASLASHTTTYQISVSVTDSNNKSYGASPLTVGVYNVSPSAVALSLTGTTINEGDTTTLSGSFADPGTLDGHTVTIVWGDGSANTVLTLAPDLLKFSASHTYLDNPAGIAQGRSFPITVLVTDKDGNFGSGATSVVVNNVPPTLGALNGPILILPNLTYTWTDTFTDPGILDTHTASVSWGDGTTTAATVSEVNGSGTVTLSHSYPITSSGPVTFTLTLTDKDGGTATATLTVYVNRSIVVLSPHASGALTVSGNGTVNIPGALIVDSDSPSALVANGNAAIGSARTIVAGGDQLSGNAVVSPAPTLHGSPLADPLANLAAPGVTGTPTSVDLSGKQTLEIGPGVYSRIQVSGQAALTMTPGVYVIAGGGFSVSGGGSVVSTGGVMIYNAGTGYSYDSKTGAVTDGGTFGSVTLSGTGTISLTAPSIGQPYAGVLIFQSRANARPLSLSGNGAGGTTGIIYAPAAALGLSGNAELHNTLVVLTLSVTGSAGAFQLASAAGSGYVASTSNWVTDGVLTVAVQDDTGNGIDPSELNQVGEAMTSLNSALGSFGVNLSWADSGADADVHIHFAATTPEGGAADGVLGFTTEQNDVYLVEGWDFYTGADPTGIGAGQYDFQTLVEHELAHTVGLGESSDPNSVMYEYLSPGTARRTFTDANLSAINSDADRYMKSALPPAPGSGSQLISRAGFGVGPVALPSAVTAGAPGLPFGGMPAGLVDTAHSLGWAWTLPASGNPWLDGTVARTPAREGSASVLVGGAGTDLVIGGEGQHLVVGGVGLDRQGQDHAERTDPSAEGSGTPVSQVLDQFFSRTDLDLAEPLGMAEW